MLKKILITILLLITLQIQTDIPLYLIFTPSHNVLFENFFLPSIQDNFDLHIKHIPQECSSAQFMSKDWTKTTRKKIAYIIQAVEENMGGVFIFSDVDIQFFDTIEDDILELMKKNDFLVQKVSRRNEVCSGFFVCRANEKTLAMWKDVLKVMKQDHTVSDQTALNRCLKPNKDKMNAYNIAWNYLPISYFDGGGRYWKLGKKLPIPRNAKMHHANWTKGVKNKIKQLMYVKKIIQKRNSTQ